MDFETTSDSYSDYSTIESEKSGDAKKLILGALVGAAVGTLVGGLFTQKGIETRNRVNRRSRAIANDIKEKASDIGEGIKEKVSNVTTPIADKYQATKKVATKLFAKEKPKHSISHLHGDYGSYASGDVEISPTKVILAAVAVSLVGTAIWSFTTEKGKTTRKRAVKGSQELAGKVKVQSKKMVEELKKVYHEAKEGMEELQERQRQQALYTPTGSGVSNTTNTANTAV